MPRPKGSKNKPKTPKLTIGNPIPGDVNESPVTDQTSPSDAVATPETLAPGGAETGSQAPADGSPVTHPDGRTGTVTGSEPRGSGWSVDVRWDGEDADTQYTPVDWREMQEAWIAKLAKPEEPARDAAPEEDPKPETSYIDDEPQPPPGIGTRLAEIGHEWAEEDAQLVAKEAEKKTVVSSYTKAIDILESRCRQLAAEYREAEWPETYDYKRGIKHVWNGRTGRIARTEKLGSYQVPLDLDRPSRPPVAESVSVDFAAAGANAIAELERGIVDTTGEALADIVDDAVAMMGEAMAEEPHASEPTPFDDPEPADTDAVEA